MSRSKPWKVVLLAVVVTMTLGFGRLEHGHRQPAVSADSERHQMEAAEAEGEPEADQEADPVSQFLTDLVGVDPSDQPAAEGVEASPLPQIDELPPLPEAYWPAPRLFSQACPPLPRIAAY